MHTMSPLTQPDFHDDPLSCFPFAFFAHIVHVPVPLTMSIHIRIRIRFMIPSNLSCKVSTVTLRKE
jgi:hypothetical protein